MSKIKTWGFRGGMLLVAGSLALMGCDKKETPKGETPTTTAKTAETPKPQPKPETPPAQGGTPKLADAKGSYKLDAAHSVVVFAAKHAGLSYTYGRFNKVDGAITIGDDAAKSSVELEIDAASIFTANKKRDDHLKNADFLNVKQFPKITFKSKEVKDSGGGKYDVTGDLTLHGVTKPVTVTMEHVGAGEFPMDKSFRTGFEGNVTIKRSDFEMKNMMEAVGDEIRLIISVEGVRQ